MQTGYKVNEKTKIGREIKYQLEKGRHKMFLEYFKKSNISFLTHPNEEKSEYNIHIYPENRMEHLLTTYECYPGWFTEKDIHIPGCITNCLTAESIYLMLNNKEGFDIKDKIDLEVTFGRNATSSRRYMSHTEYPLNSHNQLQEIKDLFGIENVQLKHIFDPGDAKTRIKINGHEFMRDTVEETANAAIEAATSLLHYHFERIDDEKGRKENK